MGMSTNGVPPSPAVLERDFKLLAAMAKFATASTCRRRALLGYFGEDLGERDGQHEIFSEIPSYRRLDLDQPSRLVRTIGTKRHRKKSTVTFLHRVLLL